MSVTEFDHVGLGAAHDLRNQSLDHLMTGVTWLGSLMLPLSLTASTLMVLSWRHWQLVQGGTPA
jgi:hypothetical protein